MLRAGYRTVSPSILFRSTNHYTIKDHHAGNAAVWLVKIPGLKFSETQMRLHTTAVCFDFDIRLRSTE